MMNEQLQANEKRKGQWKYTGLSSPRIVLTPVTQIPVRWEINHPSAAAAVGQSSSPYHSGLTGWVSVLTPPREATGDLADTRPPSGCRHGLVDMSVLFLWAFCELVIGAKEKGFIYY